MEKIKLQKLTNSPLYFSNKRTEASDEVLALILEAFEEYAAKNEFAEEKIELQKKFISFYPRSICQGE